MNEKPLKSILKLEGLFLMLVINNTWHEQKTIFEEQMPKNVYSSISEKFRITHVLNVLL